MKFNKDVLFQKRLDRVKRINNGQNSLLDPRKKRRCLRILSLTHAHLCQTEPELRDAAKLYRRAISRV